MKNNVITFIDRLKVERNTPENTALLKSQRGTFSILLNMVATQNLGAEVNNRISAVTDAYFRGVVKCRKNDIQEALDTLCLADHLDDTLDGEALRLTNLFKVSAWANYYYKTNEFDKAIHLLVGGLSRSIELEKEGYYVLIFRRIEQLQNISRILISAGRYMEGFNLIRNIIRFLITGSAEGLYVADWDHKKIVKIRQLMESTCDAVFIQLAMLNTKTMESNIYDDRFYDEFFFKEFLETLPVDTYNRTIIYNWMYVKTSYAEGEAGFFNNMTDFLVDADISSEYNVLKKNLLHQAVYVLKNTHNSEFENYESVISDYINNKL
ncbi:hypothetical protein [Pedobacter sp. L105]|uniref:hypothetical protein n=1 Tax=Pedobacter sp. L105 TaxID=1641871 RepID=UPI00131D6371|nr:hypothetical protein [Pedobacter sp. L105]